MLSFSLNSLKPFTKTSKTSKNQEEEIHKILDNEIKKNLIVPSSFKEFYRRAVVGIIKYMNSDSVYQE